MQQKNDPLGIQDALQDARIAIDSRDRLLLTVMRALGPKGAMAPRDQWPVMIQSMRDSMRLIVEAADAGHLVASDPSHVSAMARLIDSMREPSSQLEEPTR